MCRAPVSVLLLLLNGIVLGLPAAQERVFRSSTNVVVVPVSVSDDSGRFVFGLSPDAFEIIDGGVTRTVTQFSFDRVPVSLGILLDISGSMAGDRDLRALEEARWADTRRAFELLTRRLAPADEVFLALFNEKVYLSVPWTRDHARLEYAVDRIRPMGGTAIYEAVTAISPAFTLGQYSRKVLLLVSDGQDSITNSVPSRVTPQDRRFENAVEPMPRSARQQLLREMTARRAADDAGVMFYAIGIGTRKGAPVNRSLLESLTKDSGGYVEVIRESVDMSAAIARICDDLQAQYLLAFEPAHKDGKFHPISVRAKDRRLRLRYRAGYTAPGQ